MEREPKKDLGMEERERIETILNNLEDAQNFMMGHSSILVAMSILKLYGTTGKERTLSMPDHIEGVSVPESIKNHPDVKAYEDMSEMMLELQRKIQ